jgi:nitroimidazol reductase NimA-like FMN-containing flavoprotein (pyridoxamine 5'-phosphate oxidase superfamily)
MTLVDRTGIRVIDRTECLSLLAAGTVGRVGIVAGGSPLVLPVNYAMDGESVVFRTGPGSKLDAARGRAACFEIDGFDLDSRAGWSVIARGRLEKITSFDGPTFARIRDLAQPWLAGDRGHVLRLETVSISGRRVLPGPATD